MPDGDRRLDSWKAIAEFLARDVGTVRRWEKLGLPVRRVSGGPGRSVFAYTSEIDAWLRASKADNPLAAPGVTPSGPDAAAGATPVVPPAAPSSRILGFRLAAAAVVAALGSGAWHAFSRDADVPLRAEVTEQGVTVRELDRTERWRHAFATDHQTAISENTRTTQITRVNPAVYASSAYRSWLTDGRVEGGELMQFDLSGRLERTFAFPDDQWRFRGTTFGPPWAVTTFAVEDVAGGRTAVAAHHYLWDPSVVTVLDRDWKRTATFVHAGWVEWLDWLSPDRLLIGGYSEPRDGGMVAILNPSRMNGQGPEPAGSKFHCGNCGSDAPIAMAVMPRTELNRVTASRFNRAIVEVLPDRIAVRTIEIPAHGTSAAAEAVYEYTPSLELISASFGSQYWHMHRALEAEGKLDHPREKCPDRFGPRQILVWDGARGWRARPVAPTP